MKKTVGTIYTCEHCGRKITNPGACGLHEKRCRKNPKNQHPCIDCKHLIVEKKTYLADGYECSYERECKSFFCSAHNEYLFTYKQRDRSRRIGIDIYDVETDDVIECVEMPNKADGGCKDYQELSTENFFYKYNQ